MLERSLTLLRQSARSTLHRPGYAALVVLILAVVLGAGTAILAMVDSVILQALPYPHANRLLLVWDQHQERGIERMNVSFPKLRDLQEQATSFERIGGATSLVNLILTGHGEPQRLSATLVTPELLQLTGVRPERGRLFTESEDQVPGEPRVVLLSHELWQRELGGSDGAIGAQLTLSGVAYTVVGVLPTDFVDFPFPAQHTDVWVPAMMASQIYGVDMIGLRTSRVFVALGKLRAGVSREQAAAELEGIGASLQTEYPDSEGGWSVSLESLQQAFLGNLEPPLAGLGAGAILLLLIGSANVASLLLVRASRRQREHATRLALGASRPELFQQALTESLLLAVAGGLLGSLVAASTIKTLAASVPVDWPRHIHIEVSARVFLFVALLTVGIAVATAALSMLPTLRRGTAAVLATHRGAVESPGSVLGRGLVVGEVAVAVMLLVGAGLLLHSLTRLRGADIGFRPRGLLALQIEAPPEDYDGARLGILERELERAVAAIPGVNAAFVWSPQVPGESSWYTAVRPFSRPELSVDQLPLVRFHYVGPGALEGIGLRFIAGRGIREEDTVDSRGVIVLSESAARALWPDGQQAIGQQVRRWNRERWLTVIGITQDAKQSGRQGPGTDDNLDVYFSFAQEPQNQIVLLARGEGDVSQLVSTARDAVAQVAPGLPAFDVDTMAARMAEQEAIPRFTAMLTGVFAGTALFLASIGLYGLLAYSVSLRSREIALRVALGAEPARILRGIVGNGLRLALLGTSIGIAGALALTRWLAALLFEVSPSDPPTFAAAATLLLMVAALASFFPARGALRVDPHQAMRAE